MHTIRGDVILRNLDTPRDAFYKKDDIKIKSFSIGSKMKCAKSLQLKRVGVESFKCPKNNTKMPNEQFKKYTQHNIAVPTVWSSTV